VAVVDLRIAITGQSEGSKDALADWCKVIDTRISNEAADTLMAAVFTPAGQLREEGGGSWPPAPVGSYVISTGVGRIVQRHTATTASVAEVIAEVLRMRAEDTFHLMVGRFHDPTEGPIEDRSKIRSPQAFPMTACNSVPS
jgi:hypothetical protein